MQANSKPIIAVPCGRITNEAGITGYELKQAYVEALIKLGALPVLLPIGLPLESLPDLIGYYHGFLLSGGGDIDPHLFNGELHTRVYGVDSQRDTFEIALTNLVVKIRKPLLTICRGIQVLNVALGGSLYTDIDSQVIGAGKHDWFPGYPRDQIVHEVCFEGRSTLRTVLGGEGIATNSLHHQSIKAPGKGLAVTAYARDGVVEAIELIGHPFILGVQWHPEWLQADARMMRLFAAFVEACQTDRNG